jgi:hypothetical protein
MHAAQYFANRCAEIEQAEKNLEWPQPRYAEAAHCALAAVVMSVAALEAAINERYSAAADNNLNIYKSIQPDRVKLLAELWEVTEMCSILKKYELALVACGAKSFDRGSEPYQSADDLVRLRNALVHFKPEWDDNLQNHAKLETRLRHKFIESELWKKSKGKRVWFPDRCLGAGCAAWSCQVVKDFNLEFSKRLDIPALLA